MASLTVTVLAGIAIIVATSRAFAWRKAYTSAKLTDFPVFLSPVHLRDIWWTTILSPLIVPLLTRLPKSWTHPWLPMSQVFDIWKTGHKPFGQVGCDTFVLSTPRGNVLWTCDPGVCRQLEASHPKFQKAVDMLRFLDIYGPTVASVEGDEWRAHRKAIMAGFNPATNGIVWKETTRQTKLLVNQWLKRDSIVPVTRYWTNRLTLHVLAAVFFHKTLTWSEEVGDVEKPPVGYEMSFERALFTILGRLGILLLIPRFLLRSLPIRRFRDTHVAFIDFTKYAQDMIAETRAQTPEIAAKRDKSILESIVTASSSTGVLDSDPPLPEVSILGNVFFVFSAGHETAGNTLSFALDLLALYPEYQVRIQEDLDRQLAQRGQDEWSVDREYRNLQSGWLGAVLKEVLRLYCVVQWLPRVVTAPIDVVDSIGNNHVLPTDTMVVLNFSAAFQNPSTWSRRSMSNERRAELHDSPAADFDPSRWLIKQDAHDTVHESEESLHFPFGQGPHVCPGRLFALVEMTAMLATVLLNHSLELVVDENSLRSCNGNEKLAWEKTRTQHSEDLWTTLCPIRTSSYMKSCPSDW